MASSIGTISDSQTAPPFGERVVHHLTTSKPLGGLPFALLAKSGPRFAWVSHFYVYEPYTYDQLNRLTKKTYPDSTTVNSAHASNTSMKRFWIALNSTLVALSFWGGYESMSPDKLQHKNPDAYFCLAILLTSPIFALLAVGYSIKRWKMQQLLRPTWNRNPINWWGDPLQSLFITTCFAGATALGSAVRRPAFGSVGFWMFAAYCCFAIGLLLGQLLVYRVYRHRIEIRGH